MHLGSIYLVVNDFEKSIAFYEKLLEMPLSTDNNGRFVSFIFEGHCISLMNGRFDAENPEKIVRKGESSESVDFFSEIALAPNPKKFVLNFWVEDLRSEYGRLDSLNISDNLSKVRYFHYVAPYYFFTLTDPDGNMIEVTGDYTPNEGEFDEHRRLSKGWDWENVNEAYRSRHLQPTEDSLNCALQWKDAGYESVLDLGTGLGRHAICFAKNGMKVSAFDISEYGIKYLQSWARDEKLEIETHIGDMLSLPYSDNSFDCVFAYHVISHSDSIGIKKIISEIERVLKPKGAVYLSFSSKETTDFIEAVRPKVDDNTMFWEGGPDIDGSPIFYASIPEIIELLSHFTIDKIFQRKMYQKDDGGNDRKIEYHYVSAKLN